jgi:hypothetical protein
MSDTRVLIARPAIVNLGIIASSVVDLLGFSEITVGNFRTALQRVGKFDQSEVSDKGVILLDSVVGPAVNALSKIRVPIVGQITSILQQAANMDLSEMISVMWDATPEENIIDLNKLRSTDNLALDRKYGVCPIPLYEFTQDDWELFNSNDTNNVEKRLMELGVYKYFFPPKDELVVGFVDRGIRSFDSLSDAVERTEGLGHGIASNTLLDSDKGIVDLLSALKEAGYVADAEFGLETGPQGRVFRSKVSARPQESLLEKILKRLSFNLNVDPSSFR